MEREQFSAEDRDDVVLTQCYVQGFKVSQIQMTEQSCTVVLGMVQGEEPLAVASHVNESETGN